MNRVAWITFLAVLATGGLVLSVPAPQNTPPGQTPQSNHASASNESQIPWPEIYKTKLAQSLASPSTVTESNLSLSVLLPFSYAIGGPQPAAQRLDISSTGDNPVLPFTAKPDPWITIKPSSGSTPIAAQVTVDPSGFSPGSYSGAILFQGSFPDTRLPVRLNVTGSTLVVSPSSLVFQADAPGSSPAPQSLQVSASPNVDFKVSVSTTSGGNWLQSDVATATTPTTVHISTDASNLSLGTYSGTVNISSIGLTSQLVPVTLRVGPAALSITVTPNSLAFVYQKGDNAPAPQQVRVEGTNSLQFTASVSGANWLTISPIRGTVPSSLNLSVNPVGLGAGTYTGTVNIAAEASGNLPATQQIAVSLMVTTPAPSTNAGLIVIPDSGLLFTYTIDQQKPTDQFVQVNSAGSPISFSTAARVTDSGVPNWLAVSPRADTTTSTLTISVNPAGLKVGSYNGQITITPADQSQKPVTLRVLLNVSVSQPSLLQTDTSQIAAFAGDSTVPQLMQVTIRNQGSDFLSFDVQTQTDAGGPWLSSSRPSSATDNRNPAVIIIKADPDGLEPGTYTGSVTITSSKNQIVIPVALTVGSQKSLLVSQTALRFVAIAGSDPIPNSQRVDILLSGTGDVGWAVAAPLQTLSGGDWLSVSRSAGRAASTLRVDGNTDVTISSRGLTPGEYHGQIEIDSPDLPNAPQFLSVILQVLPASQSVGPSTVPTGLTFVATAGGLSPSPQQVLLSNPGNKAQDGFTANTTLDPSSPRGNFLVLGTDRGTFDRLAGTAQLSVAAVTDGLAPGVYRGTVTVIFPGNIARTIAVLLVVSPARSPTAPQGAMRDVAPSCTPAQYLPQFTSLDQQFSVAYGGPAPTDLVVIDDCGSLVLSGSLGSTFSNSDRPFDLLPIGDGRWRATWVPRRNDQGLVTVNVFAADPTQNFTNSAPPLNGFLQGGISGPVLDSNMPLIAPDGSPQLAVAAGSMIHIKGQQLSDSKRSADPSQDPPTVLGPTAVQLGSSSLLLQSVAPDEIVAVVPNTVPSNTRLPLVINQGPFLSAPEQVLVAPAWPIVMNESIAAVEKGIEILLECTGIQRVSDGTVREFQIWIGDVEAKVESVRADPNRLGIYHVRATVSGSNLSNISGSIYVRAGTVHNSRAAPFSGALRSVKDVRGR